ncbi:MAG: hypothetical protein LBJ84_04855 [Oscillospiraceae bacterium]|jgi:hypothetical protein|nr:hypothetical protein [Oscillospiraceae bacterium]
MVLKTKKEIIEMSGGKIDKDSLKSKMELHKIRAQAFDEKRAGLYDAGAVLALFGLKLLVDGEDSGTPDELDELDEMDEMDELDELDELGELDKPIEPNGSKRVFVVKPFKDAVTGASCGYGDIVALTYERIRELNTHPFGPFVWEPRDGEYGVVKAFSYGNKWYDAGAIVSAEALRYADESVMCKVWRGAC